MMKQSKYVNFCVLALAVSSAGAQSKFPRTVENKDRPVLKKQSLSIAKQITPVVKDISKSVVSIQIPSGRRGNKWTAIALGTVTARGIISKWSEVKRVLVRGRLVSAGKPAMALKVIGVYEDYDLVLLSDDLGLPKVNFKNRAEAEIGDFLVLSGTGGRPAGFGVASVKERSLREEDKAFLGIQMSFVDVKAKGVLLEKIVGQSGAAAAGLKPGDRLRSIDETALNSAIQTRSVIQKLKPGQIIRVVIDRGGKNMKLNVTLGSRPKPGRFPAGRLNKMEQMGGAISEVRSNFPSAIQTDMKVDKKFMGGPMVNLDGKFVGLALSRSRIKTHMIPADELENLLSNPVKKVRQQVAELQPGRSNLPLENARRLQSNKNDPFENLLEQLLEDIPDAKPNKKQEIQPNGFGEMREQMDEMRRELKKFQEEMRKRMREDFKEKRR